MISDYTYLYKESFSLNEIGDEPYDVFISAFTRAERVQNVFRQFKAKKKYWFILPEYGFIVSDIPEVDGCSEMIQIKSENRGTGRLSESIKQIISGMKKKAKICIDSTGFIRPTLLFLMRFLHECRINKYDMVYSEPQYYKNREETKFSFEHTIIAPIYGYEGEHCIDTKNDLLIIGAGYEDKLVLKVSENKKNTIKKLICGFPPLQADMYQENILKVNEIDELIGDNDRILISASDPFETAKTVREIVSKHESRCSEFNLYIAPLSTKAQTLGFGLYYITERLNTATSIIFPFADRYSQETSEGTGRIWKYSLEIESQ